MSRGVEVPLKGQEQARDWILPATLQKETGLSDMDFKTYLKYEIMQLLFKPLNLDKLLCNNRKLVCLSTIRRATAA